MKWNSPIELSDVAARLCSLCLAAHGRLVSGSFVRAELHLYRGDDAEPDVTVSFHSDTPTTAVRRRHRQQ